MRRIIYKELQSSMDGTLIHQEVVVHEGRFHQFGMESLETDNGLGGTTCASYSTAIIELDDGSVINAPVEDCIFIKTKSKSEPKFDNPAVQEGDLDSPVGTVSGIPTIKTVFENEADMYRIQDFLERLESPGPLKGKLSASEVAELCEMVRELMEVCDRAIRLSKIVEGLNNGD